METTAQLFGRMARVTVSLPSGSFSDTDPSLNAVVISGGEAGAVGLRIVAKVVKTSQKEPNTCEVTVYNLSPATRSHLQQQGVRMLLEAGYIGAGFEQIFVGDMRTVDHIREGADWKTVLKIGDGERAFRFGRVSESFAAGATAGDVLKKIAKSFGLAVGNSTAQAANLSTPLYHGWTAHGSASEQLGRVLKAVGYDYSIQDGAIQILAPGESLAQSIPDLSPETGLIGSPQMGTPDKKTGGAFCKFKSLLMPAARPGGRVHLKSERYDGIFRAQKITHDLDTMGGNWYTEHESIADGTVKVA